MEPRVFVVEDDIATAHHLIGIGNRAGFPAVHYVSAEAFLEKCDPSHRGCLLLDIALGGMSGIELLGRLSARDIHLPVIVVSASSTIATAVKAMKQSAVDYLEKPVDAQQLMEAIRRAIRLDLCTSEKRDHVAEIQSRLNQLTPNERDVMQLVVAGFANKQIALRLGKSQKTVEAQRGNVMKKMCATSLPDLVRSVILCDDIVTEPGNGTSVYLARTCKML